MGKKHLTIVGAVEPQSPPTESSERAALRESISRRDHLKAEVAALVHVLDLNEDRGLAADAVIAEKERDRDLMGLRRAEIFVEAALAGKSGMPPQILEAEAALASAQADRDIIREERAAIEAARRTKLQELGIAEINLQARADAAVAADPAVRTAIESYKAIAAEYSSMRSVIDVLIAKQIVTVEDALHVSTDIRMKIGDRVGPWMDAIARARQGDADFVLPKI